MKANAAVRIAGIAGIVTIMALYWSNQPEASWMSLLAGVSGVLVLVSPETVDAFPFGPTKPKR